ncbi:hypothetical protein EMPS_02400 [Entomortierella parvispora]|uniref:Beta-lactamase-related domain-containing protein n=1 Tax=Entomortierella parvispora TaxID=205924 RepID=A0A9P3H4Q5_9FUNG|nr:hypothetical protein EMPS_02400 [Entomortierella parvispora]
MSVAVMYKGEIVFAKGFGNRNDEDPFTEETLAPIGSLTKAFTSTVLGELVAEKKMDWDKTPVSTYLREFQLKDPFHTEQLTITDLLAHRTSMPELDDIAWFRVEGSRLDLIKRLKHLDFPTRKLQFWMNYSNFMYLVAGEVSARVSGIQYEQLVMSKILEPLGLTNTGFSPQEMAKNENHAIPYMATSYENAKRARILARPVDAYGLGWFMNSYEGQGPMYSHSGNIPGACANLALFPDADLAIASLSNVDIARLPVLLPYFFADLLDLPKSKEWLFERCEVITRMGYEYNDEFVQGYLPERTEGKPCLHDMSELSGTFFDPVYGQISIFEKKVKDTAPDSDGADQRKEKEKEEVEEKALFVKLRQWEGKLDHYHLNTFRTVLKDFAVVLGTLVTFETEENGQVNTIHVQLQKDIFKFSRKTKSKAEQKQDAEQNTK